MNHSNLIGGSSAERIIKCPASMTLHRKYPRTTSTHAERGTAHHWAIEQILSGGASVANLDGQPAPNGSIIEGDVLDQALKAWDEVAKAVKFYIIEARVQFGAPLEGCYGTADILSQDFILDWKFGTGVLVSAIDNYQLLFYAAAAMETHPEEFTGGDITLAIVQPPGFSTWTVPASRVRQFREELALALVQAHTDNPPLKAGSHCRWCAHKPFCDEYTSVEVAPPAIEGLPAQLEQAEMMHQWAKSVFALAEAQLNRGAQVDGWKLVQKKATKRWLPEAEFRRDLYKEVMISPAQALKKKLDVESLFEEHSSGTTLVRESDKRERVNVNVMDKLKGIQK